MMSLSPSGTRRTTKSIPKNAKKRIRGIYVGTSDEEVQKMIKDVRLLLEEERS